METKIRYHDLDWLRVLAFFLLILFHVGMAFNTWGWHVKNEEQSELLTSFMFFPNQWRIPLLMVVSGAGVWFGLSSRGCYGFMKERAKRLLLPLVVGMVIVVPPQVYFERLTQGLNASYIEFYPHFFDGIYPEGNFSWHHLWFIAYMLVGLLVLLPLLALIKRYHQQQKLQRFFNFAATPIGLILLAAPIVLVDTFMLPIFPPTDQALIGDWTRLAELTLLLLAGFLICANQNCWQELKKHRRVFLLAGVLFFTLRYLAYFDLINISYNGFSWLVYAPIRVLSSWFIILAALGYARRYLTFTNRFLNYTNEAVYPFYILHQTITVWAAYYVIQWQMGLAGKFLVVFIFTITGTVAIYHCFIRPFNVMRTLFGLKPKTKKIRTLPQENSPLQRQKA